MISPNGKSRPGRLRTPAILPRTCLTRSSGGRLPSANSREISLPTNVVIDMTTWGNAFQERSQFPPGVINPFTGYVDILLYPNGTVVPTTIYSTPSSFGMAGAFFHFWLAERSDVSGIKLDQNGNPMPLVTGQPVFLPVGSHQTAAHPAGHSVYRVDPCRANTGSCRSSRVRARSQPATTSSSTIP